MNEEMKTLERKKTWELVYFLKGKNFWAEVDL